MWRSLFIGWLAIALAEDASDKSELSKRQTPRGNTVVYGAAPGQYAIQTPDRAQHPQTQAAADYQQPSELYVISPNRKPGAAALTYSNETPRRPQYIQLSALQLQAAQQAAQAAHHQHPIPQPQPAVHRQPAPQQQIAYESLVGQTEAGHGAFYRPAVRVQPEARVQPERLQPEARTSEQAASGQYAASGIVDSQAGSFERELAQLVAANRAQEQKYNSAKKPPAPQQYLKEITRPTQRPVPAARLAPAPVQYQQPAAPQSPPLYRYVYQPEQVQHQQQYKQAPEPQYTHPQVQQYLSQSQPQPQSVRLREEEDAPVLRAHPAATQPAARLPAARLPAHALSSQPDAAAPSRSAIYVSQSTPLKKQAYSSLTALSSAPEREEESPKSAPVQSVRIPSQRNRPLTQVEFQQILQSGGYTATLVPSDNPNSPHQEYLLYPAGAQRSAPTAEKQDPVTYLLPQQQPQRQIKRRPVYNIQQA